MSADSNTPFAIEQLISRALRDNLERIQRTSDELHQAVADVVAACGSSKPANALPPMLRAQTSAASLSAALEVLTRFVAVSLQPGPRSPFEAEISKIASSLVTPAALQAAPAAVSPKAAAPASAPVEHVALPPSATTPAVAPPPPAPVVEQHHVPAPAHQPAAKVHEEPAMVEATEVDSAPPAAGEPEGASAFDVNRLSPDEQELHRRANRVAKVSMQDIKMLRPEQVRLGRQHKDICVRLRDDIEKAHREYDRRFKPIMDHPVDYFYRWMVEILAEGDAHALGDYPYATTAQHR
ncbi:MAG TPA: hypothetical protein VN933_00460 [Candidatus Eremiobacteraceae bacterium]|nr:hypothetical protein [Candidatus Eremiobacteraceae bacterium]